MTDRELLELAAKAAGVEVIGNDPHSGDLRLRDGAYWNPLNDDGDCARLESDRWLNVEWQRLGVVVHGPGTERIRESYADHDGDANAARRRASVRAAAKAL